MILRAAAVLTFPALGVPRGSISTHLDVDAPLDNQEEIIGIVVFVPNELALHLDDHQVVAVELPHHTGLPVF